MWCVKVRVDELECPDLTNALVAEMNTNAHSLAPNLINLKICVTRWFVPELVNMASLFKMEIIN